MSLADDCALVDKNSDGRLLVGEMSPAIMRTIALLWGEVHKLIRLYSGYQAKWVCMCNSEWSTIMHARHKMYYTFSLDWLQDVQGHAY